MLLLAEEKKELIAKLEHRGIKDENILNAIFSVPREKFISNGLRKFAYDDNALPIDCSQTISQPFTVAYMTTALDVQKGMKVLEIGTGSGYQSAILSELGAEVFTVERIKTLYLNAKNILTELGYNVQMKLDDGTLGWNEFAPYDRIIVTAGSPDIPRPLLNQVAVGGKLVIPVGDLKDQRLYIANRTSEGFEYQAMEHFRFVPLIGEEGWDKK